MEITVRLNGMTCEGCANSVRKVLEALPGVARADVSLEQGTATIRFDPALTGIERFKAAIADAGYEPQ